MTLNDDERQLEHTVALLWDSVAQVRDNANVPTVYYCDVPPCVLRALTPSLRSMLARVAMYIDACAAGQVDRHQCSGGDDAAE